MFMKYIRALIFGVVCVPFVANSSDLQAEDKAQIEHLLSFISSSPCKFMRNGSWYEASEAADHIRKKYNYVLSKGLIESAEDFIKYSATKSSISGKKYRVQCSNSPEIDSSEWLLTELGAFRAINK